MKNFDITKTDSYIAKNVIDIQDVAKQVLERRLTKNEIALVEESAGNYIDWFQATENSIHKH
jgi:hypothetical protein